MLKYASPQQYSRLICRSILGLALLFSLNDCASKDVVMVDPPRQNASDPLKTYKVEPEARALVAEAEQLFEAKDYVASEKRYKAIKNKFPRGKSHTLASYRLGTLYYYVGNYSESSREFSYFLSRFRESELAFDVTYNLAAAEYQLGNYEKAHRTLSTLRPTSIHAQGPERASLVFELSGNAAAAIGKSGDAVSSFASQIQLSISESKRENIQNRIDEELERIENTNELHRLLAEVSEPMTRSKIVSRLNTLGRGDTSSTPLASVPQPRGGTLPPSFPASSLQSSTVGEKLHIGVILPLSGRWAAYGKKSLDGILLGSRVYHPNAQRGESFSLFIEDSGSNPAIAAQAVDKLVENHRVAAIIGPLNWKESIAVASRSQELGVPNILLTAKEGISEKGPYLFQNALTPAVQIDNLVRFCIEARNYRRYAILAPETGYGRDMVNEFWTAVEQRGGRIVAYSSYSTEEHDFQNHVRSLVGLNEAGKFRPLEWNKLQQFLLDAKIKPNRVNKYPLPPITDFDAIFVPDSPKTVASVAASLAYFDVKNVSLLGTSEWNTEQLYKRGGKLVVGAIFPGGISPYTKNDLQKEFVKAYIDAFGAAPDLLAAQAFEAMQVVATAVVKTNSNDRNELVNYISNLRDFNTALGSLSFDSQRIARRRLPVFVLEHGGTIIEQ